jgi:hypothetical protein
MFYSCFVFVCSYSLLFFSLRVYQPIGAPANAGIVLLCLVNQILVNVALRDRLHQTPVKASLALWALSSINPVVDPRHLGDHTHADAIAHLVCERVNDKVADTDVIGLDPLCDIEWSAAIAHHSAGAEILDDLARSRRRRERRHRHVIPVERHGGSRGHSS